jgi:Zn-finger in ubiquitin-hydrolases and other protein/SnoaL-like polyketide cyclase
MGTAERVNELGSRLEQGDVESLRSYLADEFFTAKPAPGEPMAGDRITDLAVALKTALPDLKVSLRDVTESDDGLVTGNLTIRGTHQDELWGAPGSGQVIEWSAPFTVRSVGDRLAFRFDDLAAPQRVGLLRQLRLVNPPDEMDLPPHFPVAMPDFVLKLAFTGEAGDRPCSHLDQITVVEPTTSVCEHCVESGDIWPALRMCLVCGYVGCCDTSKHRHMARHYEETGHPIFRSIRDDEGWVWCYADDAFFEKPLLDRYR